jgi:glutamate dehydrogenase (NADP+)
LKETTPLHQPGNLAAGANMAGFIRVADAMAALGVI